MSRKCQLCDVDDHDRRNCPLLMDTAGGNLIAEAARLRQEEDALKLMIDEYDRVRSRLDNMIADTRAKLALTQRKLSKVRAERGEQEA